MFNFNNIWQNFKGYIQNLNQEIWDHIWKDSVADSYIEGQKAGVKAVGVTFQMNPAQVKQYYRDHGLEFVKTLTETDKAAFKDLLGKNLDLPFDQFMEKGRGSFIASDARAKVIYDTEKHNAYTNGYDEYVGAYVESTGAEIDKIWHHSDKSKVPRPEHLAVDNERVPFESNFSNGLRIPGGIGCNCWISYVKHTEKEKREA
jgi:hypothetical protein